MPKQSSTRIADRYEIVRTLVLSTSHITARDSALLDQDMAPVISFQKAAGQGAAGQGTAHYEAFGYWVHVPDDRRDANFSRSTAAIKRAGYSEALVDLLGLARRLGCHWLMLDRDGELRADLPQFTW